MAVIARIEPQGGVRAFRRGPAAVFGLAALWLALEYCALGPASFVPILDTGDYLVPSYIRAGENLASEGPSRWLPGMGAGVDRRSVDQLYIHWTAVLFALAPGWAAMGLIAWLHFFVPGYFTFRLARDDLGLPELSCWYAGLAAAASTELTLAYQGGFAFLPAVLWALERIFKRTDRAAWAWAAALGLAYGSASSLPRTLPFCLPAVLAWFTAVRGRRDARAAGLAAVFAAASVGPQLPSLWALSRNLPLSHRALWEPGAQLQGTASIWETIKSDFATDFFSAALVAAAVLVFRPRSRTFWSIAALLFLCFLSPALDRLKADWAGSGGLLQGFNLGRLGKLAPLLLALGGGLALAALPRPRVIFAAGLVYFAARSAAVKIDNLPTWLYQGSYAANYQSPVLRELALRPAVEPFRVAGFTHGWHPGYAVAYGLEAADGYINLYPRTYHGFWSKVIEPLTAADPDFDEYFNRWGNRIYLLFKDVSGFPEGIPFSRFYRLNLLSLANVRYIISRHPLSDPGLSPVLEQKPWTSFTRKERLLLRLRENFFGKGYFFVYENRTWLPRVYFVQGASVSRNFGELMEHVARAPAGELRRFIFVEEKWKDSLGPLSADPSRASVASYSGDRIELDLEMNGPGMLVVTNNYHPDWTCRADGEPCSIFPAYGTFWGISLGKAARRVVFSYEPK